MSDPARQTLARLAEQLHRRGAQDQELARRLACEDALVDDPPQRPEEFGGAVDLVQDDESVAYGAQVPGGVGEALQVSRVLQVQIEARRALGTVARFAARGSFADALFRHEPSQGRLAHLTRPQQRNGGKDLEVRQQALVDATRNDWKVHLCKLGAAFQDCKSVSMARFERPAGAGPQSRPFQGGFAVQPRISLRSGRAGYIYAHRIDGVRGSGASTNHRPPPQEGDP